MIGRRHPFRTPAEDAAAARMLAEIDEEIADHLDRTAGALEREGLDPAGARVAAQARFGDLTRIRRRCARIALEDQIMRQRLRIGLALLVAVLLVGAVVQVVLQQTQMHRLRAALDEERARTEAMTSFVTSMMANADPTPLARDVSAREVLDAAQRSVAEHPPPDEVRQRLLERIEAARRAVEPDEPEPAADDDAPAAVPGADPDSASSGPPVAASPDPALETRTRDDHRRAAWDGLRWRGRVPEARIAGAWYEVVAVGDHSTGDLLAFCRDTYGDRGGRRFSEDLVEVLAEMGDPVGATVNLRLRAKPDGAEIIREGVAVTADNRARLMSYRHRAPPRAPDRARRTGAPAELAHLERRPDRFDEGEGVVMMPAAFAEEDLDRLETALAEQHSYLALTGLDHRAALDAVRASLGPGLSRRSFAIQVRKLIALLGDGHASVARVPHPAETFLPVAAAASGNRVVALDWSGDAFVDEDHPYLAAIDGVTIERWLEAAARFVPRGSASTLRDRATRFLASLAVLRAEMDLPAAPTVDLTLASVDGASTRTIERDVSPGRLALAGWPRRRSGVLDGDIGYLRLDAMSSSAARHVDEMMPRFRETTGLIVDVRGNRGGSREALRRLFPYLMAADEPPCVVNVAAYRLSDRFPPDHLAPRFLYRADDPIWTDAQREAIADRAATFRPDWELPEGQFSDWHYMVIDRALDPRAFPYDRPVVVLLDEACFSATDIFLGALADRPRVTLLGATSGGGSGRTMEVALPRTRLEVRLSSMASFRPDGRRYDGRGIEPDVAVAAVATDRIGRTDTVLDAALARLRAEATR